MTRAVPRLMLVTAPRESRLDLVELACAAVDGGVDCVQVRGLASDRASTEIAARLATALAGTRARVLVNARFDIALAAGAHGVHLKDDGLSVAEVREASRRAGAPEDFIVGISTHDAEGLARAGAEGADHATLGPLRDAHGKPGRGEAFVVEALAAARQGGSVPPAVLLLGGVVAADAALAARLSDARVHVGLAAIRLFHDATTLAEVRAIAHGIAAALDAGAAC